MQAPTRRIAVVNCGSSSIRYQVFDAGSGRRLARAALDTIGGKQAGLHLQWREAASPSACDAGADSASGAAGAGNAGAAAGAEGEAGALREVRVSATIEDHRQGFAWLFEVAKQAPVLMPDGNLLGFGHRVVHGGEKFRQPALVDDDVLATIRALSSLAPLHNPACALGIDVLRRLVPGLPHVAVFDTAFHHTMPEHAFRYALPGHLYTQHAVRRYGFHGTSHGYVAARAAEHLAIPLQQLRAITLHLGAGASATAIDGGISVDTSMGMTPLEGLMMGTRCGDVDPALPFYLARQAGMPLDDIEAMLSQQSGLLGVAGTADMREIETRSRDGDPAATLALAMFCYRVRKIVGAYLAVLGGADALVFTGGIGENSAGVRSRVCQGLGALGIVLDEQRNAAAQSRADRAETPREVAGIHGDGSAVKILVVPTDEEGEIARQALAVIRR